MKQLLCAFRKTTKNTSETMRDHIFVRLCDHAYERNKGLHGTRLQMESRLTGCVLSG
jgi:hypothetical protein